MSTPTATTSTSTPPTTLPTPTTTTMADPSTRGSNGISVQDWERMKYNTSWFLVIGCPIALALPPRKLDLYSFALTGGFVFGANHLTVSYSGMGLLGHVAAKTGIGGGATGGLPTARARQVQEELKREKMLRMQEELQAGHERTKLSQQQGQQQEANNQGVLEKVWMGGETDGWKEKRLQEEREALEEGRGYGSLIMDHIWEVWNWGKKSEDEED
ncbi:hypothetical protein L228DRAFT_242988 [Xylona heveae TC161]|uniref:Uncharacterized protein n=1 Tax=Xylona heveae (strain CBS 132557 / TC161) TaxID=1328760 RepID=A0A165JQG8_XYLHT|nr:hypothetical protein L228DRAFT_242988 [Xylona heveae TC161]KZF26513.1 hypothetical protein L228DRAFT_242988 [Xylona heveae TC161]